MPHQTSLIALISIGLVLAFGAAFLASRLRLPPLVGYLVAGIVIGPHTPGFVGDAELAGQLAELGVILLMFGVGLHFSIGDLRAVQRIALPGAVAQIATATVIGTGLALALGWSLAAGIVFGLTLSTASTVVLLRALDGRNQLDTLDGRIAVGWLVVEDLAMVVALVLLPAFAQSVGAGNESPPQEGQDLLLSLAVTIGKVAAFVVVMLVAGRRIVPWLLGVVARTGSRELFTLAVLAVALGIAYGSAEFFGVSFALGAFFAGVVLSESDLSYQAAADSLPLQDAFAVLFFVSVGMLFDPSIIIREPLPILAVLLVILVGKSLAAFAIVLAFRYPVSTALTVSASLAQIGEFSFILAGLGTTLGLLPSESKDFILTGALLSIGLNPLTFAASDAIARWLQNRPELVARLERSAPAPLPPDFDEERLDGHAIIVGFGRVGGKIGEALKENGLPFVAIEQDRHRVEELRHRGLPTIYGDATSETVLSAAHVERARLLVVAAPLGFQARRIIELARQINPRIDTVVRTHSEAELKHLESEGAGLALMAERELALGMIGYALSSLGVGPEKAKSIIERARLSGDGGAFERRRQNEEPVRSAPELRLPEAGKESLDGNGIAVEKSHG
ncbi:MAG: Kef family K(+) transporter [Rhodospirillales bacterium]|nr:Kef family K(+) transporter [Rhodospirillales bacterium]